MNKEDRQIRALLQKADTTSREHEASLHARIMRQLPQRSQRRIYLVIIFALCIGTVVLVVTQSRDVMDEYYEHELKEMLDAL